MELRGCLPGCGGPGPQEDTAQGKRRTSRGSTEGERSGRNESDGHALEGGHGEEKGRVTAH